LVIFFLVIILAYPILNINKNEYTSGILFIWELYQPSLFYAIKKPPAVGRNKAFLAFYISPVVLMDWV